MSGVDFMNQRSTLGIFFTDGCTWDKPKSCTMKNPSCVYGKLSHPLKSNEEQLG